MQKSFETCVLTECIVCIVKHFEPDQQDNKTHTVNQQILAAIKFGVSQNKVI